MKKNVFSSFVIFAATVTATVTIGASANATDSVPNCMASGQPLPVNNDQVLDWKAHTQNQYRNRGHIKGTLVQIYPDHSGHHHYEVQLGQGRTDTVEVIYNEEFGGVPDIKPGATIEACGDYITSNARSGPYPASPDGALVHWVHMSPNPARHDSGFLVLDGVLCGTDEGNVANAGPKRFQNHRHH